MEVEVLLRRSRLKLLLNLIYFSLGLLVAEWVRESEERGLIRLGTEHVLKPQNELLIVVNEIIGLSENSSPFFLRIW